MRTSSILKSGFRSSRPQCGERSIREQLADYAADPRLGAGINAAGRFFAKHWSVLTPVALGMLTVVRLLSVAHGDLDNALMILEHADTTRLLIGVATRMLGLGFVGIGILLWWAGVLGWRGLVVVLGVAATAIPTTALVVAGLAVVGVCTVRALVPLDHPYRRHPGWRAAGAVPVLLAVGLLIGADGMWLPREAVTFESPPGGAYSVDGYVLGYDQDRTVVLHDDTRAVTIESAELVSRSRCDEVPATQDWPDMTLTGLVFGWTPPAVDQCPRARRR